VSPSTSPTLIPARFLGAVPSPVALFTAADARVAGLRLRDGGEFTRIRPAVYARTAEWSRLPPWSRYLARVHAFALTHPGAVFALESAAALLGLPLFGEPTYIHTFDPVRGRARRFGDVIVHTTRDEPAIISRSSTDTVEFSGSTRSTQSLRRPLSALPSDSGRNALIASLEPKGLPQACVDVPRIEGVPYVARARPRNANGAYTRTHDVLIVARQVGATSRIGWRCANSNQHSCQQGSCESETREPS
jgi:hypothetical protein